MTNILKILLLKWILNTKEQWLCKCHIYYECFFKGQCKRSSYVCHYIKNDSPQKRQKRPSNLCFNLDFKAACINFHDLIEKQKATQKPHPDGLMQPQEEDSTLLPIFFSCAMTHAPAAMPWEGKHFSWRSKRRKAKELKPIKHPQINPNLIICASLLLFYTLLTPQRLQDLVYYLTKEWWEKRTFINGCLKMLARQQTLGEF